MKKVIAGIVLCILMCNAAMQAQEAVLAGSRNAAGVTGTVSYSIGLTSYHTNSAGAGTVYEGVQQPFEIILIDGLEDIASLQYQVYPNPSAGKLTLRTNQQEGRNLLCFIHDLHGLMLKEFKVAARETVIPAEGLVPATYLLTITEKGNVLTTFKIIKK
jgi:hypothetical protein